MRAAKQCINPFIYLYRTCSSLYFHFHPPLHPHLLKVLDNHHVGIHVAVDAVLHASVLASCEGALRHAASDALLEADGVEFVDGWVMC
jgi:hypothetical protein